MVPLFFGDSRSPLFGLLREPEATPRGHGVVLCPPIAHEHIRAHWALRQVAQALSRAGYHCLRFDWFGVGDSGGDLRAATLKRWKSDLSEAVQELRDAAGVRRLSIVGLRMGAGLSALCAEQVKPTCLVMWDPVLSGSRYLAAHRKLHEDLHTVAGRYWRPAPRPHARTELVGFELGANLIGEIEAMEVTAAAIPAKTRVCLLDSSSSQDLAALQQGLTARAVQAELHTTSMAARWDDAREVEELLLPADAIRTITEYLERCAR